MSDRKQINEGTWKEPPQRCSTLPHQLHANKTSMNYGYNAVTKENKGQGRAGTEGG